MMRLTITVMLFFMFFTGAQAQLSFMRADVEAQISTTQVTNYEVTDAAGKTFDLSGPVYDFTGFQTNATIAQRQVFDPAVTTYPQEYPTATHAQSISTTEGSGFMYFRLDDVGFYFLGYGAVVQGADYLLKYDPERPQMIFPFKKGSKWNYTSGTMTPFEGMSRVEDVRTEVVGEGTLRTPEGDAPCLVLKEWERSTVIIEFGGQVISESYSTLITYEFFTKTGFSASFSIDSLDEASATPKMEFASWSKAGTQTSAQAAPIAGSMDIESVYPNPAQGGEIAVRWSSPTSGEMQLVVTDVYGRVVRLVHEGMAQPGHFSNHVPVQGLPSGQYFLRMTQGNGVAIRPLTIVH